MNRPTRRDLAELAADQPAYPEGDPDSRWESNELDSYIAYQDTQQPIIDEPLALQSLTDRQLTRLGNATTQQEADQLLERFAGQSPAPTKRKIRVRR